MVALGCGPSDGDDGGGGGTGTADGGTATATDDGGGDGTSGGDGSGDGTSSGDGEGSSDGSSDGGSDDGPKLDVSPDPTDIGGDPPQKPIPETCAEAETSDTTVGCLFFAVDLDQLDGGDTLQFAVAVSNVQESQEANVTVERKNGNAWEIIEGPVGVDSLGLHTFLLDDLHQEESGKKAGGAYRISSDVPIIAYQFNPLNLQPQVASSDASMLFPVSTWDHINQVVGWKPLAQNGHGAYVTVAAAFDGTTVSITPSVATLGGTDVPVGSPGVPFDIELDEGDIVEVMTKTVDTELTGTKVVSDEDHPVAVFSAAECTFVLAYSCDHLETQLSGVRLWGMEFVASRMPVRRQDIPESSVWQIYASENDTTVTFDVSPAVSGVPVAPAMMNQGEVLELEVVGPMEEPGDFAVTADKPITVVNYMTGSSLADSIGDPAMVQIPPVMQFLPRYVVLVPESWDTDVAVITRHAGQAIRIGGIEVADDEFIPVGNGFEVARVGIDDGVYLFDGDEAFSVIVVGYTPVDSYAYVGGIGTQVINPNPEG
jgi:hypothetical protein